MSDYHCDHIKYDGGANDNPKKNIFTNKVVVKLLCHLGAYSEEGMKGW